VDLTSAETEFVGMRDAGHQGSHQDIAQFGIIVDERQQRLTDGTGRTYAQQVFGSRIEFDDEEIMIEQNDGGSEAVDDACWKLRVSCAARSA
jgi:hypothetical protein